MLRNACPWATVFYQQASPLNQNLPLNTSCVVTEQYKSYVCFLFCDSLCLRAGSPLSSRYKMFRPGCWVCSSLSKHKKEIYTTRIIPATHWNEPDARTDRTLIILMRTGRECGWLLWIESCLSRHLHKCSGWWLHDQVKMAWMHCTSVSSSISRQSRLLCTLWWAVFHL